MCGGRDLRARSCLPYFAVGNSRLSGPHRGSSAPFEPRLANHHPACAVVTLILFPLIPQVRAEDADGFYHDMRRVRREDGPLNPAAEEEKLRMPHHEQDLQGCNGERGRQQHKARCLWRRAAMGRGGEWDTLAVSGEGPEAWCPWWHDACVQARHPWCMGWCGTGCDPRTAVAAVSSPATASSTSRYVKGHMWRV